MQEVNFLKYYYFGKTHTDGSISMCKLHLSNPDKAFQYRLSEETIEQHDTPQHPMTGHFQKKEGSTHHQAKYNLYSSKHINSFVKSARKNSQGTGRLAHFVMRFHWDVSRQAPWNYNGFTETEIRKPREMWKSHRHRVETQHVKRLRTHTHTQKHLLYCSQRATEYNLYTQNLFFTGTAIKVEAKTPLTPAF